MKYSEKVIQVHCLNKYRFTSLHLYTLKPIVKITMLTFFASGSEYLRLSHQKRTYFRLFVPLCSPSQTKWWRLLDILMCLVLAWATEVLCKILLLAFRSHFSTFSSACKWLLIGTVSLLIHFFTFLVWFWDWALIPSTIWINQWILF